MRRGAMLAALLLVALLVGCGGGGSSTAATSAKAPDAAARSEDAGTESGAEAAPAAAKSADADRLNAILGRQQAVVAAYGPVIKALPTRLAKTATYFRTQEEEHVDGVQKAMWGLSIRPDPDEETIDAGDPQTTRERLEFLYAMESATIEKELGVIAKLEAAWARALLAATVGNQADHLQVLRRALGAHGLGALPEPFENGRVPPPEAP
jgi:hypothetical protein